MIIIVVGMNAIDGVFANEVKSFLYLHGPEATTGLRSQFRMLHDFSLGHGLPIGSILASKRESCCRCGRRLLGVILARG